MCFCNHCFYPRFSGIRLWRIFPALQPYTIPGRIVSQFEDAFWVSIAINILLIPLIIFYFDGFALAGFFANVPADTLYGVRGSAPGAFERAPVRVQPNLGLSGYLYRKLPSLGLSAADRMVCRFFLELFLDRQHFARMALCGLRIHRPFACPFPRKLKIAGLSAIAVLVCGGLALSNHAGSNDTGVLRVDVIERGRGHPPSFRFPTGETMLVDGGGIPDDSYDIGRAVLAPFLWREGIRRLNYVALSHCHPDHALGLRFILRNFDAGSFWTSGITGDDPAAAEIHRCFDEIALKRGIKIRTFPDLFKDGANRSDPNTAAPSYSGFS